MTKLSDRARATYERQRPERRIIDARQFVAPEPASAPDAGTPDLGASQEQDSDVFTPEQRRARLRRKFLGEGGGTASGIAADAASNGPPRPLRKHGAFVVTDADGQIKVDLVDAETGDIEMEQG